MQKLPRLSDVRLVGTPHERSPHVVQDGKIGHAYDPFTKTMFEVWYSRHDRDWSGPETTVLFEVRELDKIYNFTREANGFMKEEDCWRFLTGFGPMQFDSLTAQHEPCTVVRYGKGIPDAFIRRGTIDISG